MRVDIVQADDGYFAVYVDGQLDFWGAEDKFPTLAECLEGRTVSALRFRALGDYGIAATEDEDPPDDYDEIPPRWWTDDRYLGFDEGR